MFDGVGALLSLIFWSVAVIGLAYLGSRLLAQRATGWSRGRQLEILETVAVGPRRHICLVRAGDRVLCLGVTDGQINSLSRWNTQESLALLAGREGSDRLAETTGADSAWFKAVPATARAGAFAAALAGKLRGRGISRQRPAAAESDRTRGQAGGEPRG